MYMITYQDKKVTLEQLCTIEGQCPNFGDDRDSFLVAATKDQLKRIYVYHFGFTWKERIKGVEIAEIHLGEDILTKKKKDFVLSAMKRAQRTVDLANQKLGSNFSIGTNKQLQEAIDLLDNRVSIRSKKKNRRW